MFFWVIIKYNMPQYSFHAIRYSSDVILHFHHLRCFDTVFRKPYRHFSIALNWVTLHRWVILSSFVQRPAPKNVTRFHHQDAIYMPCPQSHAMVLGYLTWLSSKARQRRKRKGKKKKIMFCLPMTPCSCLFPLFSTQAQDCAMQNLEKACARGNLTR